MDGVSCSAEIRMVGSETRVVIVQSRHVLLIRIQSRVRVPSDIAV